MNKSILTAAVVLLATALHCAVAVMSQTDRDAWGLATSMYTSDHPEFLSHRTSRDSFNHIKDFADKALAHARTNKVLFVSGFPHQPSNVQKRIYFTSVIKHGDELHRQMGLEGSGANAFAFWRYDGDGPRLLQIDTLKLGPPDFEFQPLETVLQHL